MRAQPLCAAVAAAVLLSTAPAAADDPVFDCRFDGARAAGVVAGVLSGYVAHPSGGHVEVRCELVVDGSVECATPTGSGEAVAATTGPCVVEPGDTYQVTTTVVTRHGPVVVSESWRPLPVYCGVC